MNSALLRGKRVSMNKTQTDMAKVIEKSIDTYEEDTNLSQETDNDVSK